MLAISPLSSLKVTSKQRLLLVSGITIIFALLGPYGTFEALGFGARLIYWSVLLGAADVCLRITLRFEAAYMTQWELPSILAASVLIFVLIYSPPACGMSLMISDKLLDLREFHICVWNVLWLTLALGVLTYFVRRRPKNPTALPRARLYERVPVATKATIMRLTVNDHYVDVFLDDGTHHRVLMRLADAIREMDETPGFCTHRSHWVSSVHVTGSAYEQKRDYLLLTDGTKVPVSKTYRESVVTAGFL